MRNERAENAGRSEVPWFPFADWIAAHCVVPNGFDLGKPFELVGWQLDNAIDFYRVKPDAVYDPARPRQAAAFRWRRGQIVGGQKLGKSLRAQSLLLRVLGLACSGGWAKGGETFRCSDWGCSCGFEYEYSPGEPMGMPRRTALIQLLATSEEQTANVYRPLQSMVRNGTCPTDESPRRLHPPSERRSHRPRDGFSSFQAGQSGELRPW